jgi:hypothetical protein
MANTTDGVRVEASGASAVDGNVTISAERLAAGRDITYYEGLRLRTRMRPVARRCIKAALVLFLLGFLCFGYFVISWNGRIFDMVSGSNFGSGAGADFASLPSPSPWIPLGAVMFFAGLVLVVVALLLPRDVIQDKRR